MEENSHLNQETVIAPTDELVRCKQQYAYLQADFDNYRKRIESQRGQWSQSAQADVLTQLIEIVDDFDRAQHDIANPAFELIYKAFKKVLARFNVTEIEETHHFDPSLHEAIMQTPLIEGAASGSIAQILQKGYKMGSLILRPAKVAVYE